MTVSEQTEPPLTNNITEIAAQYRFDTLPPDVIAVAKHCLLDWIGVTVAGMQDVSVRILLEMLQLEGGRSRAHYIGTQYRGPLLAVSEALGTAAHALDFDDLHVPAHLPDGAIGHPTAPVIAALLPIAEAERLSGRQFLTALVAGIEAECRVGLAVAPGHYAAGWHSTATIGTFGATAAVAHALDLSAQQWQYAFGLSGMQAQGLKSMFGTMAKPYQVGKAASNGVRAALLASKGYTSNPHVLECEQGFCQTQSPTYKPAVPSGYEILKTRFKKYASCGGTHPTIDGVQAAISELRAVPSDVARILVRVHPSRDQACNIFLPQTPLEGKFSLRYVTALALRGNRIGISDFTPYVYQQILKSGLLELITVQLDATVPPAGSVVGVQLHDGRYAQVATEEGPPERDKSLEWDMLTKKCLGLIGPILGDDKAHAVVRAVSQLEDTPSLRSLVDLCVPTSSQQ